MVAGGVGLAPFASLAEALARRGTTMTLFYGGRRAADIYCEDLFERLGVRLVVTTEDGSRGEPGRVTGPLKRATVPKSRNTGGSACSAGGSSFSWASQRSQVLKSGWFIVL